MHFAAHFLGILSCIKKVTCPSLTFRTACWTLRSHKMLKVASSHTEGCTTASFYAVRWNVTGYVIRLHTVCVIWLDHESFCGFIASSPTQFTSNNRWTSPTHHMLLRCQPDGLISLPPRSMFTASFQSSHFFLLRWCKWSACVHNI